MADTDNQTLDPQTTVDLAPCHFGNTFTNPCFWILLGVALGAAGAWFLTKKDK